MTFFFLEIYFILIGGCAIKYLYNQLTKRNDHLMITYVASDNDSQIPPRYDSMNALPSYDTPEETRETLSPINSNDAEIINLDKPPEYSI